jgi:two-component system NtrC family sensor kinase
VSSTGYSASAQDAARYGVAVLQKPYDLESLRRHIREAMEQAKIPPVAHGVAG